MRTIEAGWNNFREHAIQAAMDPRVKRDLQAAFYAGAGYAVDELMDLQVGQTLPDDYAHHLTRWASEMARHTTRTRRESDQA